MNSQVCREQSSNFKTPQGDEKTFRFKSERGQNVLVTGYFIPANSAMKRVLRSSIGQRVETVRSAVVYQPALLWSSAWLPRIRATFPETDNINKGCNNLVWA